MKFNVRKSLFCKKDWARLSDVAREIDVNQSSIFRVLTCYQKTERFRQRRGQDRRVMLVREDRLIVNATIQNPK